MPSPEARETEPLLAESAQRLHDETDIGTLERRSSKSDTIDWKYEAYYIVSNSAQLSGTYLLSYFSSLLVVLVVSRLGRDELASVSLATTTMNILGFSIFEGLATALDTLCSQAYGAGKLQHVGLHTQRMILFLLLTLIADSCYLDMLTLDRSCPRSTEAARSSCRNLPEMEPGRGPRAHLVRSWVSGSCKPRVTSQQHWSCRSSVPQSTWQCNGSLSSN